MVLTIRTCLILLVSATILFHTPFLHESSIYLYSADRQIYSLFAHQWAFIPWQNQERHLFPFKLSYGGLGPFTIIRIAILWITRGWSDTWIWESSHVFVSAIVTPIAVTLSTFFFTYRIHGLWAALTCGLIAAAGFPFPESLYGLDTFGWFYCAMFLVLGIRGKIKNPFETFSNLQLFLIALLLGYSTYVMRASAMLIPIFFLPSTWVKAVYLRCRNSKNRFDRFVLLVIGILLALSLYTTIFGREWGTIFGKRIVVDAFPNVRFAILLFGLWSGIHLRAEIFKLRLSQLAVLVSGFFLGFFPEIYAVLTHQSHLFQAGTTGNDDVNWHKVFGALEELLRGRLDERDFQSVAWWIPALWIPVSIGLLIRNENLQEMAILPSLGLFFVNLYFFFRVKNSEAAASRYLIAVFPLFIYGLGHSLKAVPRALAIFIVSAICFCFVGNHAIVRSRQLQESHKFLDRQQLVIELSRKYGFHYVYADNHWEGVPSTVLARGNPLFVQALELRVPWVSDQEILSDQRGIGIFFPGLVKQDEVPRIWNAYGKMWDVKVLETKTNDGTFAQLTNPRDGVQ